MTHRVGALIATAALLGVAGAAPAAAAPPLLTNERLIVSNSFGSGEESYDGDISGSFACDSDGESTLDIVVTGNAYGPYPGTFTHTTSATVVAGLVTRFEVGFEIVSGATTVTGNATYTPGGGADARCELRDFGDPDEPPQYVFSVGSRAGAGQTDLWLDYSAEVTSSGETVTDEGVVSASVLLFCGDPSNVADMTESCAVASSRLDFVGASAPRSASGVGTASTGADATEDDPVATTIVNPAGGEVSITEGSYLDPDSGYRFLGRQIFVGAENGASPEDPIRLTFEVDESVLYEEDGVTPLDPSTVTLLRDGVAVADCSGSDGDAEPDPCVDSRTVGPDGDLTLLILTSQASEWQVVAPASGDIAVSINDVRVTEGDSGTRDAVFTLRLAEARFEPITVRYATRNGTATAGSDYSAKSGSVTFSPGQTRKTVAIAVRGDTVDELNERFFVVLTGDGVSGARGRGAIADDDPRNLRIRNVTITEGDATKYARFTVRLSTPSKRTVTVRYATANGTARAPRDYTAKSGALIFSPGQTTKRVSIAIRGENVREDTEYFYVDLADPTRAVIADRRGVGRIRDDDPDDPVVVLTKSAPTTADQGARLTYSLSFRNLGPLPSRNASVTDTLPAGVRFVSASDGGTYDSSTHRVRWSLGTVDVGETGTLTLTTRVRLTVDDGAVIVNRADFRGDATTSAPAYAETIIEP